MSNSSKFGRSSIFFIEGSIGVGKSSFIEYALENATTLFPKHEVVVVSENYQDNPFLSKFYSNPRKYALLNQEWFLEDECQILEQVRLRELKDYSLGLNPKITLFDRSPFSSNVFSKTLYDDAKMPKKDYKTFIDLWKKKTDMFSLNTIPAGIFLFEAPVNVSFERIQKRGRPMEKTITTSYLERLKNNYTNYFLTSDLNQYVYRINSGSNDINFYVEIIRVINSKMEDI